MNAIVAKQRLWRK